MALSVTQRIVQSAAGNIKENEKKGGTRQIEGEGNPREGKKASGEGKMTCLESGEAI
jgi:hypothetical protein